MKPVRLMSGFMTVGFWTLASRVLGFLREILIAAYIGPGPLLDAFVAAFRLPNLFRRFFAEGAFNAAFVPMFSKRVEAQEDAQGFAQDAFNLLGTAVLVLTALGMIFMPALVWATAGGFVGDERFDIATGFGRIMFPYIFFMSLAALFSGVLNAKGRFAAAAAAPVLLNVITCVAMVGASALGQDVVEWLVWTIPVAGLAQLLLVWVATVRSGTVLRPRLPRLTPEMVQLLKVAFPAALAMGVTQVNLVVGQIAASGYENAVSWLFIADRLYQLPLGVVGIAVGVVLLPDLSRRLRAGDETGAREALSRAGESSLLLTVPSAVAFLAIPMPLVSVMYQRGATGADDVAAIAVAVAIYGAGLPAFVMQKVLQPLYFAREDTKSPFRFALVAMVLNAALALGLQPVFGWVSPAIGATVAGWAMVALLWRGAARMGESAQFDARFRQRVLRIIFAAAVMGLGLYGAALLLTPLLTAAYWRYFALLGLITFGAVLYFAVGQMVGALRLSEFKASFRRGAR